MNLIPALIQHGLDRLATASPHGSPPAPDPWPAYESCLAHTGARPQEQALSSIFCRVALGENEHSPLRYYRPRPLSLTTEALYPSSTPEGTWTGQALHQRLLDEWQAVPPLDDHLRFEVFYHLFRRHAWAIPCTLGEPGVSLFEQWKGVAALAFASGDAWAQCPAEDYTLIGGDIPGIQDFVYTITSKGAAKGLRGRSFFVQLLNDAVLRRIVRELGLSSANVVFNAAGNFVVLAPASASTVAGRTVAEQMREIQKHINEQLLQRFSGDLSVCLAWQKLTAEQVGTDAFAAQTRGLRQKIADRKRQRFADVARDQWAELFAASGEPGNRACRICQRPLGRDHKDPCPACSGFNDLATQMDGAHFLSVAETASSHGGESWQEALHSISGCWYELLTTQERAHQDPGALIYLTNSTNVVSQEAHGFRLFANVTPHATKEDVERSTRDTADDEQLVEGQVRTLGALADAARGVSWLGVLRMDVDNLGQIMASGLATRSMITTSALSSALDLFFSGWLPHICAGVNADYPSPDDAAQRGERIYLIYAGGDDLFAVGAWDAMAELAGRIQQDFAAYTAHNPDLHLSAGLTLHDRSFPIYQAADQAGEAEDAAKRYRGDEGTKNAMCFLGIPVSWRYWPNIAHMTDRLVTVVQSGQAPRALVRLIEDIYGQYQETVGRRNRRQKQEQGAGRQRPAEPSDKLYYGPWVWRRVYALSRMAERVKEPARPLVKDLMEKSLSGPSLRCLAVAARWAELLLRKED